MVLAVGAGGGLGANGNGGFELNVVLPWILNLGSVDFHLYIMVAQSKCSMLVCRIPVTAFCLLNICSLVEQFARPRCTVCCGKMQHLQFNCLRRANERIT